MPVATKPPRQWALEIARMKTLDERRAALEKVPEKFRPMVKTHLKNTWAQHNKKPRG